MVGVGGPARRSPPPWLKFPYRDHPDSEIRALLIAEQFNPRRSFRSPCEDLLAVHKRLGPLPKGVKRLKTTEAVTRALNPAKQA